MRTASRSCSGSSPSASCAWLARRVERADVLTTSAATLLNPISAGLRAVRAAGRRADGVLPAAAVRLGRREGPGRGTARGTGDVDGAPRVHHPRGARLVAAARGHVCGVAALAAAPASAPLAAVDGGRRRRRLRSSSDPQIYISKQQSDSFNPYPSTTPRSRSRFAWGITLLKFATVEDEGHWRGLTYWSPCVAEPEEDKTAGFYLEHPLRGAFLMLTHAYAGFHYDQIKPYWRLDRARPLTIWLRAVVRDRLPGRRAHDGRSSLARELDADRAFAIATLVPVRGVARVRGGGVPVRHHRIRDAVHHRSPNGSGPGRRARSGRGSCPGCSCTWRCPSSTTRCCCKVRISSSRSILFAHVCCSPAMLAADSRQPPRVPLHWLWNERETDSTYTVSAERRDWLVRERGYADMGPIGYVDARPGPPFAALDVLLRRRADDRHVVHDFRARAAARPRAGLRGDRRRGIRAERAGCGQRRALPRQPRVRRRRQGPRAPVRRRPRTSSCACASWDGPTMGRRDSFTPRP